MVLNSTVLPHYLQGASTVKRMLPSSSIALSAVPGVRNTYLRALQPAKKTPANLNRANIDYPAMTGNGQVGAV